MTGAQRLRLVLALGVVNLVLATVALGVGITGTQQPQIAVVGPTAPPAIVTPGPGSSAGPISTPAGPTPTRTPPNGPGSSGQPGAEPSPIVPPVTPSAAPSPSVAPSPSPSIEPPVPSVAPSGGPVLAGGSEPDPAVAAPGSNDGPGKPPPPKPTPTPTPRAPTPVTDGRSPCHASDRGFASSGGKACNHKHDNKGSKGSKGSKADKPAHHDNGRHTGQQAGNGGRDRQNQPAIVESPRRSHTSRHRLRTGRRAR